MQRWYCYDRDVRPSVCHTLVSKLTKLASRLLQGRCQITSINCRSFCGHVFKSGIRNKYHTKQTTAHPLGPIDRDLKRHRAVSWDSTAFFVCFGCATSVKLKPNTHRRREETVLSRRVGGVYMNSRRLPTDSAMRKNCERTRQPSAVTEFTVLQPMGHDCRRVCSHRRHDETVAN